MLRNCVLPVQYNNLLNNICGEIICQSETSFTIVCKLCELKIFQFDEFVKHFRLLHWPDINQDAVISKINQNTIDSTEDHIKSETILQNDGKVIIYEEYDLDDQDQDYLCHLQDKETEQQKETDAVGAISKEEDSFDSYQSLAILKKVCFFNL